MAPGRQYAPRSGCSSRSVPSPCQPVRTGADLECACARKPEGKTAEVEGGLDRCRGASGKLRKPMHAGRPVMGGRQFAVARLLRALVAPLAIALPPLFWVVTATDRASRTPLGRDQGIFQYVAWALAQGRGRLPRRARRQRPAHAPHSHRLPRARRRRRAPLSRARPRRHGRDVRVRRRVRRRARFAARAGLGGPGCVGARGLGRPERAVPALRLLGPRPARELLRLVHAAERRAPARRAGAARRRPRIARRAGDGGCPDARLCCSASAARSASSPGSASRPTRSSRSRSSLALAVGRRPGAARARGPSLAFARRRRRRRRRPARLPRHLRRPARVRAHPARRRPGDVPLHLAARGGRHLLESVVRDAGDLRDRRRGRPPLARPARRDAARRDRARARAVCALASVVVQAKGFPVPLSPGHGGRAPAVARLRGVARRADARGAAGAGRSCGSRRSRSASSSRPGRDGDGRLAARPRHVAPLERRHARRARDARVLRALPGARLLPVRDAPGRRVPARAHEARRPRADLRDGPVRPLPRRAPERHAVHLRVRPRRRRGARGRHRRRARRRAVRAHPRHSRRARGRPARQARRRAPRPRSSSSTTRRS